MSVTLKAMLNRDAVPAGETATLYLLVQLEAVTVAVGRRPPLNLAAVMDCSGSMEGDKIEYTKRALQFLVDHLDRTDYLTIIKFDNQAHVLLPATKVTNKDALKAEAATLAAMGSTNLSGGMVLGYQQVRRHRNPRWVNRLLLMTDGMANVGVTDPQLLAQHATGQRERGIQLTTLGVGVDFQEDLLTALATAGGGNFYFIQNPDEIPSLFARELQGLLATVAQGLQVSFSAGPDVTVRRVIGYPPAGDPSQLSMDLPDIYSGEVKSLVFELAVGAGFAGQRLLGTVALAFTDTAGVETRFEQPLGVLATDDRSMLEAPETLAVLKHLHLARSAEALDQAVTLADSSDFKGGGDVLEAEAEVIAQLAATLDDAQLKQRAADLQEQATRLKEERYDNLTRKSMKTMSFQTRTERSQKK